MVGSFAISLALAASAAGVVLYTLCARGKTEFQKPARLATYITIGAVFTAAATLLFYIFNYRFDINYVYEHVSRSLSTPLLFSTFYASQEGSFMLWALLSCIVALFLIPYARRQRYEAPVMAVYLSILVFLTLMLVVRSPFETIYAAHPGEVPEGFIPPDGKGLNPSLENLWIAIHPPMLFLGFTLIAVPFSFALAGLFNRDYQGWLTTSLPWTLGAGMILGFGIILGGFWAYETLGWGGYWAWDPVENASLLPWLITVAAFHTMITQKRTGGLVRTNIAMTLLAFALVLYCSFLTRSGILGEASVHAFVAPGNDVFRLLVVSLFVFVGGSFGVFFYRFADMRMRTIEYNMLSRETALSIGAAVIGASALVIFIGTSAPLVSKKVDISFYGDLHIPIAIVLMLVNGLSLSLKWKQSSMQEMLRKSALWLALAVVFAGTLFVIGLADTAYLAIIAASTFALLVNIDVAYGFLRGKMGVHVLRDASVKTRIVSALKWSVLLGVVAMLLASGGDYYKFGEAILGGGLYWSLFTAGVIFAFLAVGAVRMKFDSRFVGAYTAHIGLAVFVLGVVASSHYEEKKSLQLVQYEPQKIYNDYTVTFLGLDSPKEEHYYAQLEVKDKKGNVEMAEPMIFRSSFDNFQSWNPHPSILKFVTKDLYFSLNGMEVTGGADRDSVVKGQTILVFDSTYQLTFNEFDFSQEERAKMINQEDFTVKANLEIKKLDDPNAPSIPVLLSLTRNLKTEEVDMSDFAVPGTNKHIKLSELRPNLEDRSKSSIILQTFEGDKPPAMAQTAFVDSFIKPYINLVWIGVLVLTFGFGFSMIRRRKEALTAIERAEAAFVRSREIKAPSDDIHPPVAPAQHLNRISEKKTSSTDERH